MTIAWKFAGVAALFAVAAATLSRVIWPDIPGMDAPSAIQLPFFILLSVIEAAAFGLGMAFLIFGFGRAMRVAGWPGKLAFLSTVWLLISWWPHDNLHRVMHEGDFWGLLRIEYGFHVTLMIAAGLVAYYLWTLHRPSPPQNMPLPGF